MKLRDLLSKDPKYREPVSYSWHQNFGIIMDAREEYVRLWAKKEEVDIDTISEWIKSIADVLKYRIRQHEHSVNTRHESIFSYPNVIRNFPVPMLILSYSVKAKHLTTIHLSARGIMSAYWQRNLDLTHSLGTPTYIEVLDNHKSILTSFGIETRDKG